MRAMILAAGRGERMRPLTDHTPKPLLLVNDKPLIAYHLEALAKIGVHEVVINVSHLAQTIVKTLGNGKQYGVEITYSFEPVVGGLETGGGIFQALPLLGKDPFMVISGDVWTRYDFSQLPQQLNGLAHLVMVKNPDCNPRGDFDLIDGRIVKTENPALTFASFGVYHPDLFKDCQAGFFRLTQVLLPAIAAQQVSGELFTGEWHNLGTIEQWQELCKST